MGAISLKLARLVDRARPTFPGVRREARVHRLVAKPVVVGQP